MIGATATTTMVGAILTPLIMEAVMATAVTTGADTAEAITPVVVIMVAGMAAMVMAQGAATVGTGSPL